MSAAAERAAAMAADEDESFHKPIWPPQAKQPDSQQPGAYVLVSCDEACARDEYRAGFWHGAACGIVTGALLVLVAAYAGAAMTLGYMP